MSASGFWYRHSRRVMRRPVPVATGASVLLIALGLPFLRIEFTGVDASVLPKRPDGADGRRRAAGGVPAERDLAGLHRGRPARRRPRCGRTRARLPAPVEPPRCRAGRIDLIAPGAAAGRRGEGLRARRCGRCRRRSTSPSAGRRRSSSTSRRRCARTCRSALAILCATTLIILFFMTRSVVLPVKALIMNLLTL